MDTEPHVLVVALSPTCPFALVGAGPTASAPVCCCPNYWGFICKEQPCKVEMLPAALPAPVNPSPARRVCAQLLSKLRAVPPASDQ